MKVFFEAEDLDPNSKEMKKLYIKDVHLGEYNYGLYSRLRQALIDCSSMVPGSKLRSISGMNTYVNGIIYHTFNINVWDLDNPIEIKGFIEKTTGLDFNEWLEIELNKKLAEAQKQLKDIGRIL